MRRSVDFDRAVRCGVRAGRRTVVVHLCGESRDTDASADEPVLVGFVVSKAVGNAVTRNLVKRRLRAAMSPCLPGLAPCTRVVVRALPAAASAGYDQVAADLGSALAKACRQWSQRDVAW